MMNEQKRVTNVFVLGPSILDQCVKVMVLVLGISHQTAYCN